VYSNNYLENLVYIKYRKLFKYNVNSNMEIIDNNMPHNYFFQWIDNLPDENIINLTVTLWDNNPFDTNDVILLKKHFKKSRRVFNYYIQYVIIGD
jgi:hypothetical protein